MSLVCVVVLSCFFFGHSKSWRFVCVVGALGVVLVFICLFVCFCLCVLV